MDRWLESPVKVFFRNFKQGLGMIFTVKRNCKNCGAYLCNADKAVCVYFPNVDVSKPKNDCGDWRPKW